MIILGGGVNPNPTTFGDDTAPHDYYVRPRDYHNLSESEKQKFEPFTYDDGATAYYKRPECCNGWIEPSEYQKLSHEEKAKYKRWNQPRGMYGYELVESSEQ